ncbi:uncharacterized protein MELLADRAFT_109034 [Melampsora larici-populina 98AG31]|uniref:DH domain-containing protein n=1 Tax=Melampsora larici-populina (strain 98AG31 / pathotype 3-4-7) TaxID=747676 RepID=F4RV40_MELLP|nr:uncharacterized protein MELLADRAFT_109034 [Melampsora larici-populina 98AG31]EGG03819.1 hypothetical protein MELLADRAFT_109034 [Melampsora larici-populina 98AG31]
MVLADHQESDKMNSSSTLILTNCIPSSTSWPGKTNLMSGSEDPDSSANSNLIPTHESNLVNLNHTLNINHVPTLTQTHTHSPPAPQSGLTEMPIIEYQHEPLFWLQRQLPIEHLDLNNPIHTRQLRRYARIPSEINFLSELEKVKQRNQSTIQPLQPSIQPIKPHLSTYHSDSALLPSNHLQDPQSSSSTMLDTQTHNPDINQAQARPTSTFSISASSNSNSNSISPIFDSPVELPSRSPTPLTTPFSSSSKRQSSPHLRNTKLSSSSSYSQPASRTRRLLSPSSRARSMMQINQSTASNSHTFESLLHPNTPIDATLNEDDGDSNSNSWSANRNSITGTPDLTASVSNTISEPSLRSPLDTRPTSSYSAASLHFMNQLDSSSNQKQINQRLRVIAELIDTEASYARDMAITRDIYSANAVTITPKVPPSTKRTNLDTSTTSSDDRSKTSSPFPSPNKKLKLGAVINFGSKRPSTSALRRADSTGPGPKPTKKLLSHLAPPNPELINRSSPPMSNLDQKTIFSNIEEIACLAEEFTILLRKANKCNSDGMDDTIGTCFFQMLPRIQQVFMTYCSKYQASNNRLQSLLPNLMDYLNYCNELSRGCTTAWDLSSLLIKPVQRCMKYPLLLDQISQLTPLDHPDRHQLEEAKNGMIAVADSINEAKRRCEHIEEIMGSKSFPHMSIKRPSSKKGRTPIMNIGTPIQNRPLMVREEQRIAITEDLNKMIKRIYKSRQSVIELPEVILDWSSKMNQMSKQSSRLVKAFKTFYTLHQSSGNADFKYLNAYQQHVALASAVGPFKVMEARLRETIIPLCKTLLKTYENPLKIILKRNPRDVLLEDQLIAELPKFEAATQKIWNSILCKLNKIQQDVFFDIRVLIRHFNQTYYQKDKLKTNQNLNGFFDRFSIIDEFFDPVRQQAHESFVLLDHHQLQAMMQSESEGKVEEKIGIAMPTY